MDSVLRFRDAAGEIEPSRQLAIDSDATGHEVGARNNVVQSNLDFNRLTGANHPFEFGTVDASRHRNDPFGWRDMRQKNRTALQATLAQDDAWYEWEVGKVPLEEEFVGLKRFPASNRAIGLVHYLVNQKHRLAMGDNRFDLLSRGSAHGVSQSGECQ
jgi:hypothetical protein